MDIWTPGFYRGRDCALDLKMQALRLMRGITQSPWVDISDITAQSRRRPALHPLRIPVVLPSAEWIGDYFIGHGFAPLIAGGSMTTYNDIINARANGKADDIVVEKLSQTTVASNWSCFWRSGGFPAAGTNSASPGSTKNNTSVGAWPIAAPSGSDKKYLLSLGVNHQTGTNIVMLFDLLYSVGAISATSTAVTLNTTALSRYTGTAAAGNMLICDISTALGATAATLNISSYTNSAGTTGRATGANSMITSGITFRHTPGPSAAIGFMVIPLQSGDLGVRSVESLTLSASMTAGAYELYIIRPLMLIPTIATTSWVERDSTLQIDGLTELVLESGLNPGCLAVSVLTSTTSTGLQAYQLRTCMG